MKQESPSWIDIGSDSDRDGEWQISAILFIISSSKAYTRQASLVTGIGSSKRAKASWPRCSALYPSVHTENTFSHSHSRTPPLSLISLPVLATYFTYLFFFPQPFTAALYHFISLWTNKCLLAGQLNTPLAPIFSLQEASLP
jgi:hypothetical protein